MRTHPEFQTAVEAAQEERDDRLLDRALTIAEQVTPQSVAADGRRLAAIRERAGQLHVMRRARER
jgi:flagellar biosynthesis/type III secretory pathway protein FliH